MGKRDERLLADFVALFYYEKELDEGAQQERPIPQRTDPKALELLYEALPARLPRLYEQLILSYRWPAVELRKFELLANPPGPDLTGLLGEMKRDRWLWQEMIPRGWIPFAQGPGGEYDPVCFQVRSGRKSGDSRVVQLDHEQMLCYSRIVEVEELASSFRELVELTVADAGLSNWIRSMLWMDCGEAASLLAPIRQGDETVTAVQRSTLEGHFLEHEHEPGCPADEPSARAYRRRV